MAPLPGSLLPAMSGAKTRFALLAKHGDMERPLII